jgi:hypothetical protein
VWHGPERRSVGCTHTPLNKGIRASRHLVQTDLFSHGCRARLSNSRRRLACPACRDDGIGFLTGLRWRRQTAVDAGGSADATGEHFCPHHDARCRGMRPTRVGSHKAQRVRDKRCQAQLLSQLRPLRAAAVSSSRILSIAAAPDTVEWYSGCRRSRVRSVPRRGRGRPPKADIAKLPGRKQKDRLAAVSPKV